MSRRYAAAAHARSALRPRLTRLLGAISLAWGLALAAGSSSSHHRETSGPPLAGAGIAAIGSARVAPTPRAPADELLLNGGFSAQPNPLAFWTNAPGAFATWLTEGANASQGAVHVRFLPPLSVGGTTRGAVFYTGLTQCVSISRPGRYLLRGFARVPEGASPSSFANLAWTLRTSGPNCIGPATRSGRAGVARSTAWTASSLGTIEIGDASWTADTTVEIGVQVGDSSTTTIEAVEAIVDELSLIEGPLFTDGFEE